MRHIDRWTQLNFNPSSTLLGLLSFRVASLAMHFDYRWGVFSMNSTRGSCDQTSSFGRRVSTRRSKLSWIFSCQTFVLSCVVDAWLCRSDVCTYNGQLSSYYSLNLQQNVAHPCKPWSTSEGAPCFGLGMVQAAWKRSSLALTICAATTLLHLGAPPELLGP